MKKTISLLLSFIMMFSCLCSVNVNFYAATQQTAQQKLDVITKQSGFIPGKPSIVQYNCYGFVAALCEELYGVTYNGEGLYDNYKCSHSSGRFKTVKTYTTTKSYPDSDFVNEIIEYFTTYGRSGDVVHYGARNSNYRKTHTFMIYSVDSEKMRFIHANYGSQNVRLDTVYWKSFKESPTSSTDSSMNSFLYATMRLDGAGGIGISINRYSDYDTMFSTTTATTTPVNPADLKIEKLWATSNQNETIGIKWSAVKDAKEYFIAITNKTKGTKFSKTVTTNYTNLNNLTKANTYVITVKAVSKTGVNGEASPAITVTTGNGNLPSTDSTTTTTTTTTTVKPADLKIAKLWATSNQNETIGIKWSAVKDAKEYYIAITNKTKGTKFSKTVTTNYTNLNNLTKANTYVITVKAVSKTGVNGAYSPALTVTTGNGKLPTTDVKPAVTGLVASGITTNSVTLKWNKLDKATAYEVYIYNKTTNKKVVSTSATTNTYTNKKLTAGNNYYAKVRAKVNGAWTDYCANVNFTIKPNAPSFSSLKSNEKTKLTATWTKPTGAFTGYEINWSRNSNFTNVVATTNIANTTTLKYTGKNFTKGVKYYVRIRTYLNVGTTKVYSPWSKTLSATSK